MTHHLTSPKIESLRSNLSQVRQASLHATRTGDFMRVARLSVEAARINKFISDAEGEILAAQ